jgi:hypothetical protein
MQKMTNMHLWAFQIFHLMISRPNAMNRFTHTVDKLPRFVESISPLQIRQLYADSQMHIIVPGGKKFQHDTNASARLTPELCDGKRFVPKNEVDRLDGSIFYYKKSRRFHTTVLASELHSWMDIALSPNDNQYYRMNSIVELYTTLLRYKKWSAIGDVGYLLVREQLSAIKKFYDISVFLELHTAVFPNRFIDFWMFDKMSQ